MNDQIYDDRARSYIEARTLLERAAKVKSRFHATVYDGTEDSEIAHQLPDEYWSLIAEADVLAKLATADAGAGFMAGNWIVGRDKKERAARQRDLIDTFKAKRSKAVDVPFAQGHRVRVKWGDYAGRTGNVLTTTLSENEVPTAEVGLDPDGALVTVPFGDLELEDGTGEREDGSCGGCGALVDEEHGRTCPVWNAQIRASQT